MSAPSRSAPSRPGRRPARRNSRSRPSRASAACRSTSSIATAKKGSIYDVDFEWLGEPDPRPEGVGLHYLDHLTHNVDRGRLTEWAGFYERLFNFRQIRYFDIAGKMSGLHSRAMTSPDGKIRIPINEDAGESGQIEEYLQEYKGEGIQHVALGSTDLYESIEKLIARGRRVHAGAERDLLFAHRQAPAEPRASRSTA